MSNSVLTTIWSPVNLITSSVDQAEYSINFIIKEFYLSTWGNVLSLLLSHSDQCIKRILFTRIDQSWTTCSKAQSGALRCEDSLHVSRFHWICTVKAAVTALWGIWLVNFVEKLNQKSIFSERRQTKKTVQHTDSSLESRAARFVKINQIAIIATHCDYD